MIRTSTMTSARRARRGRLAAAALVLLAVASAVMGTRAAAQTAPDSLAPVPPLVQPADSSDVVPVPPMPPDVEPTGANPEAGDTAASAPPTAAPGVARAADPNPRPVLKLKVQLVGEPRNVVRAGPGERYAIVAVYEPGLVFPVIAKSGAWYNLRLSESETGWIHASLCKVSDDLSDLEFRPNPKLYTRTGSYVVTAYAGGYAFDRKSNSLVIGGRLGYYVFDRLQADVGFAYTHISRPREIVESLFGLTLEAEKFHMLFYSLNLTWEILPGRQMVPFVTGGVGSSIMQGEVEPSFNYGAGTSLFLSKRMAMRWEVRSYRMHTGAGTSRVANDNIEFTLGTHYLF